MEFRLPVLRYVDMTHNEHCERDTETPTTNPDRQKENECGKCSRFSQTYTLSVYLLNALRIRFARP